VIRLRENRRWWVPLVLAVLAGGVWLGVTWWLSIGDFRTAGGVQSVGGYPFFDDEAVTAEPTRAWFPRLKGVAFFATSQATDADLARLQSARQLEEVFLGDVNVTDAGLVHLAEIQSLRGLQLSALPVTDAGLRQLKGLKKLRWLIVEETAVTPAAIAELRQALPHCDVRYSNEPRPDLREQLRKIVPEKGDGAGG
jgi:hypothetical protein